MDRVNSYDIFNNPAKAWNALSDQIKHLDTDFFIMMANKNTVGEIPQDIQTSLRSLKITIERALT